MTPLEAGEWHATLAQLATVTEQRDEAEAMLRAIDRAVTERLRRALDNPDHEIDGDGSTASLIVNAVDLLVETVAARAGDALHELYRTVLARWYHPDDLAAVLLQLAAEAAAYAAEVAP